MTTCLTGVIDHEELLRRNTQHLMSAVSSLPELQVRACLYVCVRSHVCARVCCMFAMFVYVWSLTALPASSPACNFAPSLTL